MDPSNKNWWTSMGVEPGDTPEVDENTSELLNYLDSGEDFKKLVAEDK